jgi:hypothetical protein
MDRIGSLYVDNTTGISYRLTMYITDFNAAWAAQRDAMQANPEITDDELRVLIEALPQLPRYSMFSVTGGAGSVDVLPDTVQRIWQPAS